MNLTDLTSVTVTSILHNIQNAAGPLAGVLFLLVLTALADTATGLFAAWKSGTLDVGYIDTFLTSHVQNKWLPILGTLFGGVALGGVDNVLGATLVTAAVAQIVAYETATFGGSITQNLSAASAKNKGLPGQTALMSGTIEGTAIGTTETTFPVGVPAQIVAFHPNGALASISIANPATGGMPAGEAAPAPVVVAPPTE